MKNQKNNSPTTPNAIPSISEAERNLLRATLQLSDALDAINNALFEQKKQA